MGVTACFGRPQFRFGTACGIDSATTAEVAASPGSARD